MRTKLAEAQLEPVYKTYDKYLKALRWIQAQGIPIDWGMVHDRRLAAEAELERIMYKELGYDPGKQAFVEHRLFNVLGLPVLSRTTKTQKPQVDVAILQRLRAGTEKSKPGVSAELDWILKYRQLQKANGNWYAGYERYKDSTDLLHPNFKVHGTATGRLSCEAPNLQQIPRDYQRVKAVFRDCPEQDEILYELDYSQIELRVAAYYSKLRGDPTMFNIYKEGEDVHTRTTELVGAFDQIENPKEARQVGKTGNFLWIYGGGAKTMSVQLFRQFGFRSTVEQCAEWTAAFNEAYPGFRECIHHSEKLHRRLGYITMWNGRRRHIRERDPQNRVLHRKAFNSRVQGGSGQLLAYALIRLHQAYEKGTIKSRVCNTVHDSIWVLVPRDRIEEEIAEMIRLMRITPERHFHLPFEVDAKAMVQ
jgi:DNA polymerase I-like protein with 3'-5' exonuclease and polymerase domains